MSDRDAPQMKRVDYTCCLAIDVRRSGESYFGPGSIRELIHVLWECGSWFWVRSHNDGGSEGWLKADPITRRFAAATSF